MKKSTKKLVWSSLLSAGGAIMATAVYRKVQKITIKFIEDADKRNNENINK
ncbi:hypothetical protein [Neobacillus terrae]|uniref:hypothetical protein n=1 Tax=Neobacillus terrae TaxID=3034837 RepID=UPI00140C807B|nr:hypothetical protein [Neobacillus terrae]NHM30837.1 hypothetical protein [Neobacillus terrae]